MRCSERIRQWSIVLTDPFEDECEVRITPEVDPYAVQVGPPYNPDYAGAPLPPPGLKMLLALIDGRRWPLHNCGDTSIGINATPWGFTDETINKYALFGGGEVPDYPLDPPHYPGVGVTAYACQLNCNYLISGPLGADVIIGKIDDQWQVLRVTGSASTAPLTGPSDECRCCGGSRVNRIQKAEIIAIISGSDCAYEVGTQFRLDPITHNSVHNPLGISISCQSTPESLLEDIDDWSAYACGVAAEVRSIDCCVPYASGSGFEFPSGSGSGSGLPCRFEAVIRTAVVEGCSSCSYDILIWDEDADPCIEFEDEPFDEPVLMEACGLPNLEPQTRVIMLRIPGGIPGREALDGQDPIEWFVVRACTADDCANPCDVPPPEGPLCCGAHCSELSDTLSVSIEMVAGDLACTPPIGFSLQKWGGGASQCDGASDTRWSLAAPIPDHTLCPGTTTGPIEGVEYPVWLDVETATLVCGAGTEEDTCGHEGSGSGSGSGDVNGPPMSFVMGGGLNVGEVAATQNLVASCCNPLYLEYEITGAFGMVDGAGDVPAVVTLRIIITD